MPMLLLSSYFIYMYYQPSLVVLILFTTAVSYVSSIFMEKSEKAWVRKLLLSLTLTASLGVLFFYKYFDFLVGSLTGLFGKESFTLNLILPVGISFYTFQTLSYVIDVYRKRIPVERNFLYYALFVSYFPQLVAGPIERPENLLPQLKSISGLGNDGEKTEGYKWNSDDALKGAKHMMVGFFKKIVVADLVSVYVNSVYNSPEKATGLGVIIATALFAVQIYCDFSGYTDIAIGCARIMGIRLMKNFDHPYTATTIKEFWGRWHISLSTWFKDYLYFPLGGSRCSRPRHLLNLMIVFAVSGLWHGAAWTFVIWGALHGVYQVIGTLTIKPRNSLIERIGLSTAHPAVVWTRRVITFILVDFAWLFFRANSISDAFTLIGKLGGGVPIGTTLEAMGLTPVMIVLTVVTILTLTMIDKMLKYEDCEDGGYVLTKNGGFVLYVMMIMLAWLLLLSKDMASTFIYFQF
jgi:D-alanyl-lipoteichoic acid acyltransferase DltB (MBOAT superfamily)